MYAMKALTKVTENRKRILILALLSFAALC
jgi:hypothetical protein